MATLYWFIAGVLIGAAVGSIVSVLWAPLLRSARLHAVFAAGPLRHWRSNYTAWFAVLGASHTGLLVALMYAFGSPGVALAIIVRVSTGFGLVLWAVTGVTALILAGNVLRTTVVTGLGAAWYTALMTGIPYAGYLFYIL